MYNERVIRNTSRMKVAILCVGQIIIVSYSQMTNKQDGPIQ